VINVTLKNKSDIVWLSLLLVEEIRVMEEISDLL